MKNISSKKLIFLLILITFILPTTKIFSCPIPTNLTLNYTFTTSVEGASVEVTWTSDCLSTMMEITLVNIPLWTGQKYYAYIPNTGSYFSAIHPNIIPGETLFFIRDMGNNIWSYGPEFDLTAPLPVELSAFHTDLTSSGKEIEITFQTPSELNVSHFDIQHSSDGRNFLDIGKVQAYGPTSIPQSYSFIHDSPAHGQ
jgi:hypothetical protein